MSEEEGAGRNEDIFSPPNDSAAHPPSPADVVEHETLKYHLLGPSLTKSGQDTVDQQKVSEIIYDASKGSKFFNNEEVKDKVLTEKIERILGRKRQLEKLDLTSDLRRADEYIAEQEMTRDLSQHVVHIDCDAFYAAVEELDRPELRDVPMAVGKGVLTTCNYHARKFGCRSGMAGFVARKLCPELICLPLNFEKYTAKAQEVRAVLAEYDPRFESASIDEAYLNITAYCEKYQRDPEDVVAQIRAEVHEKAKVTISAGIAANAKLAKICSNKNKPNGQFKLANDRSTILAFMRDLSTRKVNGVGRVFERELGAIGVKTCGDIYEHRAILVKLFGVKAFQFLITCFLGLGRTNIQPAAEYERKSVGTESTFREISGKEALREKLGKIAEELERDLKRTQVKGRTLVLKIKLHTYEVYTRQTVPPKSVSVADELYRYALPMLEKLEKEIPDMRLRLMGLRVTHIISTKKAGIDFFGLGRCNSMPLRDAPPKIGGPRNEGGEDANGDWEAWPESEFEEAARQERQDEMNEVEALSQQMESERDFEGEDVSPRRRHGRERVPNPVPISQHGQDLLAREEEEADEVWACPVCGRPQSADDRTFNEHIDLCLSRQTIHDAVKETSGEQRRDSAISSNPAPVSDPLVQRHSNDISKSTSRKRGRPGSSTGASSGLGGGGAQKKLFFSRT